jgi:serine/threonine protein kinase
MKLIDFGLSKTITDRVYRDQYRFGTRGFTDPYTILPDTDGNHRYTFKTDIFSLGISLFMGIFYWSIFQIQLFYTDAMNQEWLNEFNDVYITNEIAIDIKDATTHIGSDLKTPIVQKLKDIFLNVFCEPVKRYSATQFKDGLNELCGRWV